MTNESCMGCKNLFFYDVDEKMIYGLWRCRLQKFRNYVLGNLGIHPKTNELVCNSPKRICDNEYKYIHDN